MEANSILSVAIGSRARAPADDIFISTRGKDQNQMILQVATETCFPGFLADDEDGKQDMSPSRRYERPKRSHDCILQMNTSSWAAAVPPRRRTSAFILDSRATTHVVGDVSLFSPPSYRSTSPPAGSAASYQTHDGRVVSVAGAGTVSCDNFRIPNVRCVPDLICTGLNLVSVQQLAECGYLVMFGGGQCSVMEQSSCKIVGKGRLHADDGMYHLEFLSIIPHDDKACEDDSKAT